MFTKPTAPMSPEGMFSPAGAPGGPDPDRFAGIRRDYSQAEVDRLSGSFRIRHTLAEMGANRLWELLKTEPYVHTLGALTGNQAMQQVKAGLKAIYLSGWQVAADANVFARHVSGPVALCGQLGSAGRAPASTTRCAAADQIGQMEGEAGPYWMAPIVADAEAGFGGAA